MRKYLLSPNIVGNGVLWIAGTAMQIGGWVNQTFAIILLAIALLWSIISVVHWFKNKRDKKNLNNNDTPKTLKDVGNILTKYYQSGIALINTEIINDTEFSDWKDKVKMFITEVFDVVKEKCSDTELILPGTLTPLPPKTRWELKYNWWGVNYNNEHSQILAKLDVFLGNLKQLIDRRL